MRIGSSIVLMGGIGGVSTHPDFRERGYASALMHDAVAYMKSAGYHVGLLLSTIPFRFYRKLGWVNFPTQGFRITEVGDPPTSLTSNWSVEPFVEARDLEQAVGFYNSFNARQSGSLVRPRAHWDTAPARIRHLFPTVVSRRGDTLGGYLNYRCERSVAEVLEVAYRRDDSTALAAMVDHLVQDCASQGIQEMRGDLPYSHPLAQQLVLATDGDLTPTGHGEMMLYAVDLLGLLQRLLSEWQARLDASDDCYGPTAIGFEVNQQHCTLTLDRSGRLRLTQGDSESGSLQLTGTVFWNAIFGAVSWGELERVLEVQDVTVPPADRAMLERLFPVQPVTFWTPDRF